TADVDRGTMDFADVQEIERDTCADDIGNRVDCPDFMEVDLLDGHSVDLSPGLAKPLKNLGGVRLGTFGDGSASDQIENVRKMTVRTCGARRHDAELGGRDASALGLFDLETRARIQRGESVEKRGRRCSGVN